MAKPSNYILYDKKYYNGTFQSVVAYCHKCEKQFPLYLPTTEYYDGYEIDKNKPFEEVLFQHNSGQCKAPVVDQCEVFHKICKKGNRFYAKEIIRGSKHDRA